ncbi:S24 family peptidase [Algivirga pacifica]|uniref:HTH cro/C1-type domain-containing protein n=1 Tax=Algivirga pacifica TaxID=1162670 RepID=A0ABP9DBR7_9BACT
MSYIATNLKYIRTQRAKQTQEEFAKSFKITRSKYCSYEDGRVQRPAVNFLMAVAKTYDVSMDDFYKRDLSIAINNESSNEFTDVVGTDGASFTIAPVNAAAGYTPGVSQDTDQQAEETYRLPFLSSQKKYKGFKIYGDSMWPFDSGTVIVGEQIDKVYMRSGDFAVVVTRSDGPVFKRVLNNLHIDGTYTLQSTNPKYNDYQVLGDEVVEVWKFAAVISQQFPMGGVVDIRPSDN